MIRPVRANEPEPEPVQRQAPPRPTHAWLRIGPDDPPPTLKRQRQPYKIARPPDPDDGDALCAAEVGELLGVTSGLARAALRDAGIRPVRKTQWQRLKWPKLEVLAWLEQIAHRRDT